MKTVSREVSQRLKDAGWEKETDFYWIQYETGEWECAYITIDSGMLDKTILHAPTLDEVLDDLSYDNLFDAWYSTTDKYLTKWLYITMRSADAAAEVWLMEVKR